LKEGGTPVAVLLYSPRPIGDYDLLMSAFTETTGIINQIIKLDEQRSEVISRDLQSFEANRAIDGPFSDSRELLEQQTELLDSLDGRVSELDDELDRLKTETKFLTVDQAVRHREMAISKLESQITHLNDFLNHMAQAISIITTNLETLEQHRRDQGLTLSSDPEQHIQDAHEALESHNEAIEGLDRNLTILNAYLL
jgi:DNA repair exonuclease SbcCD ATPase subunit